MKNFGYISGICFKDMAVFQNNTFSAIRCTSEKQEDDVNSVYYQYGS